MMSRVLPSRAGTAINLFVQPFPRLSVDIDLAYLPLEPRTEALRRCREALQRLAQAFNKQLPSVQARLQDIGQLITDEDVRFLLSFKRGVPEWQRLSLSGVDRLPAVRWKVGQYCEDES